MTKRRVRLPPGAGAGTGFRDHGVLDAPWPRWKTVRADESSPIPSAPDQPREQPKAGTGEVPGLLKRLAAVPDPRGVRHALVVVLDQQAGGARGGRSGSRARRSAPTKVCTAPTAPSGGSVHRSSTRRAGGRSGDRPRSAGPHGPVPWPSQRPGPSTWKSKTCGRPRPRGTLFTGPSRPAVGIRER